MSGAIGGVASGVAAGGRESQSVSTPQVFGPEAVSSTGRTAALKRVTPSLVERGLRGPDPKERKRLKTRAFEDIGLSTKGALGNLRETFGRTGVRGGVQGSDVADILEAAIGAKGRASTDIEGLLKGDAQQQLESLLTLLTSPEPFAVGTTTLSGSDNPLIRNLLNPFDPAGQFKKEGTIRSTFK